MSCPFCAIPADHIVAANALAFAIRDAYPVSQGHTLVIPRRHLSSFFEAKVEERLALLALIDEATATLDREFAPAGYNIGFNDGAAAGQTVMHLHIHIIPRFDGDQSDPRGGIRWVLPEKADYWSNR
jgi:diadenosine tetraphosphate (Ap4A) HIT family hydrolase